MWVNSRKPPPVSWMGSPSALVKRAPSAASMPTPPSLVALPPRPIISLVTP
ncbi:Uncharacterised protein [Vibrio cholerae]|nr:Uncharacterised protein [Vibrio cholerae]